MSCHFCSCVLWEKLQDALVSLLLYWKLAICKSWKERKWPSLPGQVHCYVPPVTCSLKPCFQLGWLENLDWEQSFLYGWKCGFQNTSLSPPLPKSELAIFAELFSDRACSVLSNNENFMQSLSGFYFEQLNSYQLIYSDSRLFLSLFLYGHQTLLVSYFLLETALQVFPNYLRPCFHPVGACFSVNLCPVSPLFILFWIT